MKFGKSGILIVRCGQDEKRVDDKLGVVEEPYEVVSSYGMNGRHFIVIKKIPENEKKKK